MVVVVVVVLVVVVLAVLMLVLMVLVPLLVLVGWCWIIVRMSSLDIIYPPYILDVFNCMRYGPTMYNMALLYASWLHHM